MNQSIPSIHDLLKSGINDKNNRNILLKILHYKYKAFCKSSKCKSVVEKLDLEIKFQKHIFNTYGIKFNLFSERELTSIYAKKMINKPNGQPLSRIIANYLHIDTDRMWFAAMLNSSKNHSI